MKTVTRNKRNYLSEDLIVNTWEDVAAYYDELQNRTMEDKDGMIEIGSVLWRRICSCTSVCFCQISFNRDLSAVLFCKFSETTSL